MLPRVLRAETARAPGSMARGLVKGLDCDVLVVPHDYHAAGAVGSATEGSPMGPGAMA